MSRMIDADKLSADMYHEAFEKDSDMQKWDSGCWIRYKMFENVLKAQPTMDVPDINVGNMDTTAHDSIPAETGKNDGDRTSGDCISRTQAIEAVCEEVMDRFFVPPSAGYDVAEEALKKLPSAQPEPEAISEWKKEFKEYIDSLDITRDDWKGIIEYIDELPSIQIEIIRCGQCKYAEVADPEDSQDGYTCQFHRGSIWFSGSYCSWAERRQDATD